MVPWLWTRLDQVGPGDPLGYWIIAAMIMDSIFLIIDANDVVRYVTGNRKPAMSLSLWKFAGQALDDVTALVDLAALDGGGHAESIVDRLRERLCAIDAEPSTPIAATGT